MVMSTPLHSRIALMQQLPNLLDHGREVLFQLTFPEDYDAPPRGTKFCDLSGVTVAVAAHFSFPVGRVGSRV